MRTQKEAVRSYHKKIPVETRFWAKVKKGVGNDCWVWTGSQWGKDRGAFFIQNIKYSAYRIAWELTYGAIPSGLFVCHHCDNPICVRPDHLFIGTPKDNTKDMIKKGRKAILRGESSPRAKLNSNQVKEIREKYRPYEYTMVQLAREYNVTRSNIYRIIHNINWKE